MDDSKLIAYYILQDKYLNQCGLDLLNEDMVLKNYHKFFPDDWELEYSLDKKIEFISIAIKDRINLKEVAQRSIDSNDIIK